MPSLHILANMHNNRVDITKTIRQICVVEALILSFALACKKKISLFNRSFQPTLMITHQEYKPQCFKTQAKNEQ